MVYSHGTSSAALHSPPFVSPPLHSPLRLRFRPAPPISYDALLLSLPPDEAANGEKAESSQRQQREDEIERAHINEETTESRGHQQVHKARRQRLTLKASLEHPDA